MDENIVNRVLEALDAPLQDDDFICIKGAKFNPIQISKDYFTKIAQDTSDKKILFIDSGNQEIVRSPSTSLQFIRVYYTIYQDNKRIQNKKVEFYALLKLKEKQSAERTVEVECFDTDIFKNLEFDLDEFDGEADLSTIGNLLRRLSELKVAQQASEQLENSFIVLDGSLFAPTQVEQFHIKSLTVACNNNNNILSALSKTSHLTTDKGRSAHAAIFRIKPDFSPWSYAPLAEITDHRYQVDPQLVLLNKSSEYVFLLEIATQTPSTEILPLLAANSTDPVFRGYPYGLVEADNFARVSDREKEQARMTLLAKAGPKYRSILESENPLNAHSILDNIL